MYPRLEINLKKIYGNAAYLNQICTESKVQVAGVTKVVCGSPLIGKEMIGAGMEMLADSRIENIAHLRDKGIDHPIMLLRIPMVSELEVVNQHADYVMVSEMATVQELVKISEGRQPKLILMVDVGDLREGVWIEEAEKAIKKAIDIAGGRLVGVGTNLGCFGGVLPDPDNTGKIVKLARSFSLSMVSAGNTSALKLIEEKTLPEGVNHFRLGESVILGTDVTGNRIVPGTVQDACLIGAQIVELMKKPSMPVGKIGQDAFGRVPVFEDKGWMRRAILAMGEQDISPAGLLPVDEGIEVLHASSDHTILDCTHAKRRLSLGEILWFRLTYGSLLRAMTSPYVSKGFVV